MLSFSHTVVARYYYALLQKKQLSFELDKRAFLHGNILPDLERSRFNTHHWDESRSDYEHYLARAKDGRLGSIERSEALGIVCHFMCDYFCKFHTIQPYRQIQDHRHFLYEAMLHVRLRTIMIKRTIIRLNPAEEAVFSDGDLYKSVMANGRLDHLMNTYLQQSESLVHDLSFQLAAVRAALMSTFNLDYIENEMVTNDYALDSRRILTAISLEDGQ